MVTKNLFFTILIIATLAVAGCVSNTELSNNIPPESTQTEQDNSIKTASDGTKYIVNPKDILSGGPPQGGIGVDRGIPALAKENIKFIPIEEADYIQDNELVLVLNHKGEERVYPLQIMTWHEIANDNIQGDAIIITYCPLCGSGIAYESYVEIDGIKTETRFGTSGKLYNSNLIMYDEATETYWQQIGGQAIVGELTGQTLTAISLDTVVWLDYKNSNPNAKVLSQDTGINRNYGRDPYGNYYENSFLLFPVDNEDDTIHPKTIIFGIEHEGNFKAYKEDDLINLGTIEDTIGETNIIVTRNDAGIVTITADGKELVKERDMRFAWYAFHPTTLLFESE